MKTIHYIIVGLTAAIAGANVIASQVPQASSACQIGTACAAAILGVLAVVSPSATGAKS